MMYPFLHMTVEPKMRKSEAQKIVDHLMNLQLDARRLTIHRMFLQTHGKGLLTDKGQLNPLDTFAGTA